MTYKADKKLGRKAIPRYWFNKFWGAEGGQEGEENSLMTFDKTWLEEDSEVITGEWVEDWGKNLICQTVENRA